MKRDIVCCLRLVVDSLPSFVRNSKIFFEISRALFNLPPYLFFFRGDYRSGLIPDLSIFYIPDGAYTLARISDTTDINSMHIALLKTYIATTKSNSFLDAGCGSGYLIENLSLANKNIYFTGIDYHANINKQTKKIGYRAGDLLVELENFGDNSVDFVLCAHVIEHLSNPKKILRHLKRISSKCLVIICPLEKEFRWGMNYHVNFFPDKAVFSAFLSSAFSPSETNSSDGVTYVRLGDIMYVETYEC